MSGAGPDRWIVIAAVAVVAVVVGAGALAASSLGGGPVPLDPIMPMPAEEIGAPDERQAEPDLVRADASFVDIRTGRERDLPRLIRGPSTPTRFAVSPDGRRIAFVTVNAIHIARVDGEGRREVVSELGATDPAWSPSGRKLAYTDGERILVLNLSTGRTRALTSRLGRIWRPNFSPDGRRILFTLAAAGELDLWTVPATGGHPSPLLRLNGRNQHAAFGVFGPDGTIAYRRTGFDGAEITQMTEATVWLADADGKHRRPLRAGSGWMSQVDPEALWPTWSPDGTKIAFERLYNQPVAVFDLRTGLVIDRIVGADPTWLDSDTLIVEAYGEGRQ